MADPCFTLARFDPPDEADSLKPPPDGAAPPKAIDPDAVILEFEPVGALDRVSVLEPNTLTEVVIYRSASAGEANLRRLALRKLITSWDGEARVGRAERRRPTTERGRCLGSSRIRVPPPSG